MLPNDPRQPYLCGLGFAACGSLDGGNTAGRLTKILPRQRNRHMAVEVSVDPVVPEGLDPNVNIYTNDAYLTRGGSGVYRVSQVSTRQAVTFDAIPIPAAENFKNYVAHLFDSAPPSLRLSWDGDPNSIRYTVEHARTANKSDSRRIAILGRKENIEVVNETGNDNTITVTGNDGNSSAESSYTVTVSFVVEVSGHHRTVTIVDNDSGYTIGPITYADTHIRFGSGLQLTLPEIWLTGAGDTVFTVTAGPPREYYFRNATGDDHYFRVAAEREDDATGVGPWVYKEIDALPGNVTTPQVDFVSSGTVEVSFTMPSDPDIAGYKIYLGTPTYPADSDLTAPLPLIDGSAGPSEAVSVQIADLEEGRYTILVRAYDTQKIEDGSLLYQIFFLSAASVSMGGVAKPRSFDAQATGVGQITFHVRTSGSEDSVYLYSDGGDGNGIDYDSPWAILLPSSPGYYEKAFNNLPAGDYEFGARSALAGIEEKNTDVISTATVFDSPMLVPSNLRIEVLQG